MSTNIPLTGKFQVTCEYKRKGNWACGWHTGIDLVGDDKIYSSCDGKVVKIGYDKSYGNYIVVRNNVDGKYHWFCHLSKISAKEGIPVSRTTIIGIMGNTGNSTGKHLHFEIRNSSNNYADNSNPADYMGIPNKVGSYNSADYQIADTKIKNNNDEEDFVMAKKWKNGSTNEDVYADINLTNKIGTIFPQGEADCYQVINGKYLICYNVYSGNNITNKKTGFVKYHGGVK